MPAAPHSAAPTASPEGASTDYDVAVIGGGINGAGVAREAAYRGYRTVLFEKDDFAQATSSQSTKLIHGGIRYLETGHFRLVYESLRERRTLLRIAPHLVSPLELVIPIYKGSVRPPWMVRLGTLLYDLLAGSRNLGRSRRVPRRELRAIPGLRQEDLSGAVAYFDAQALDSRLCLETALSAREAGARVLNHHPVTRVRLDGGRYEIEGEDLRTGQPYRAQARAVVNATGPWVPFFERDTLGHPTKPIAYDRGIHFVIPSLGIRTGLALMGSDRRLIFVLPWRERFTLIGTTESRFVGEDFTDVPPSEEEIAYLLLTFNGFFPRRNLKREEVRHIYSGVRALAVGSELSLTRASRESEVEVHLDAPGTAWLVLYGGKLTSYRSYAVKIVDEIARRVPPPPGAARRDTATVPLPGGEPEDAALAQRFAGAAPMQREVWRKRYGSRWTEVARRAAEDPRLAELLVPGHWFTRADLAYMVEVEQAYRLRDITLRRTKLIYDLTPAESERLAAALQEQLRAARTA
jgi:glycerol-3-phosphate dehydrogenase